MREFDTLTAEAPAPETNLREQADALTAIGHELHNLLDSLEDRLFDPLPREVAKNGMAGNASALSVGQNLRQTRKLTEYGLDRLRSALARI